MRKKWLFFLTVILMLPFCCSSCAPEAPVMPEKKTVSTPPQRPSVEENYYGYVNFDYITHGQMPPGKFRFGTLDNIEYHMEEKVSDIIDKCVKNTSSTDIFEYDIREMYEQYLDTDAREKAGISALMPVVGMIESCQTPDEMMTALSAMYHDYGTAAFFNFKVAPDCIDTSVYEVSLRMMNTCGNMKENFTRTYAGSQEVGKLTENVLNALQVDPVEAKQRAKNVAKMMSEIMRASMDSDLMQEMDKHYNPYTKEQLRQLLTNIDTDNLLQVFGFDVDHLIVFDVGHMEKINEYLTPEHLREMKDYCLACLMFNYQSVLPPSYMQDSGSEQNKEKNTIKSAKKLVAEKLEEEIGVVYGKEICTAEKINATEKMLEDIRNSCRDLISKCSRLGEDAKAKCLRKLDNIIFLLGYNKDYRSPFEITAAKDGGNLLMNTIAIYRSKVQQQMAELTQPVNRYTWDMSPITVNAVYSPFVNTVTIPAAVLSDEYFDLSKGEYRNLGMLGYIIAHEMNHAFDSHGCTFDENGCYLPEWLSEEERTAYAALQEKTIAYYSNYMLLDVYRINGKQTLSENLADLGAMQCLANITDNKEELQQLFEGVAEQWAALTNVESVVMQLSGELHSPGEARVNAVLSCMDKFYEVYDIKETDKMYVSPDDRIRVW